MRWQLVAQAAEFGCVCLGLRLLLAQAAHFAHQQVDGFLLACYLAVQGVQQVIGIAAILILTF